MLRSRAPRLYPLRSMLRGTLLPSLPIAAGAPERLREIVAAGHEVGIHGFDHVRWHDQLFRLSPSEVRDELDRACRLFEELVGQAPGAFAAPGWQCSAASLRAVDERAVCDRSFRYRSDTRGHYPYRPTIDGYVSSLPELPTTLPTLDELLGLEGRSAGELTRFYLGLIPRDRLSVHTVHTEVEGGPCLGHLDALLRGVRDLLPIRALGDIASALAPMDRLPIAGVAMRRLRGRGGRVACQVVP
jgi:peptidoglycan/xylan/chitin deacetylase (PgdA/CDA1 family)